MSTQNTEGLQVPYSGDPYLLPLYRSDDAEAMHLMRQQALMELASGVNGEAPALVVNADRLKEKIEEIRLRRQAFDDK